MRSAAVALALLLSACAVHIGDSPPPAQGASAPRPSPAPAPAPAPQPAPHHVVANPTPAAPAPRHVAHVSPSLYASSDPVNVAYVQQLSLRRPKGCGPREVAPGVWVRLDCHKYKPIAAARPHWSAAKARAMKKMVRANLRYYVVAGGPKFGSTEGGPRPHPHPGPTPGPTPNPTPTPTPTTWPDVVDHRTANLEGPIKDQGYVGSCTAFSLSSTMDNMIRRAGKQDVMSPTHVWAHYGYPGMEEAGDGNLNKSITSYEIWPYSGKEACEFATDDEEECGDYYPGARPNSAKSDPKAQANLKKADGAGLHKLVAYERLSKEVNIDEVKSVLASGADLWIAMMVGETWMSKAIKGGVIDDWDDIAGGHAIVMSGYRKLPNGKHQFLIHNSWGESWADHGYGWISEAMVLQWMDYAYRLRLDNDAPSPSPKPNPAPQPNPQPNPNPNPAPVAELTDDDCAMDELIDSVTGQCAAICADDARPANGCKTAGTGK